LPAVLSIDPDFQENGGLAMRRSFTVEKILCDCCEKETRDARQGDFKEGETRFSFYFNRNKKEMDLCNGCQEKVVKYIEEQNRASKAANTVK
jgi:hypothetical protein